MNSDLVQEYDIDGEGNFEGSQKEHFATDFLMDRGIEFMEKAATKDKPFALVLSIPDPHGKCTSSIFHKYSIGIGKHLRHHF